ncbi:E3 ubiquitin ligase PQT3-like-like protein [Drosera capensis]
MSINFKFRSSATFDAVDLRGRSSITIRDLRSEILSKKHLNLCPDVELLISDIDGREFDDEDIQLPSGSSVIIKRVPAGSLPPPRACNVSVGNSETRKANDFNMLQPCQVKVQVDEFDDFGAGFYSPPDQYLPAVVHNVDEQKCSIGGDNKAPVVSSDALKDPSANEGSTLEVKSDDKVDECAKLARASSASLAVTRIADLPYELKCPLCRALLKDAVMIPCCQHSVCLVLSREGKCPICSLSKCRQGDLLPNLSLRQAIGRFLESRLLVNNSEADLHGYAPDGESGIEVKDASCALTIGPDNRQQPIHPSHLKHKFSELEDGSEFQGENQLSNVLEVHEEEACTKGSERFCDRTRGGERNLNAAPRQKKAERTCYMCGSPDHLIRDCPVAASSRVDYRNDMPFAGASSRYGPPYWHQTQFTHMRPFPNMCGSHMMMPYNVAMGPQFNQNPFAVPSYNPNIYSGFLMPSNFASIRGTARPAEIGAQQNSQQHQMMEHQDWEARRQSSFENSRREPDSGRDIDFNEQSRYDDRQNLKPCKDRSLHRSGDSNLQMSEKMHRRQKHSDTDICYKDRKLDKSSGSSHGGRDRGQGRSTSGIDNPHYSSIRQSEERHKRDNLSSSGKNYESKGHHDDRPTQNRHDFLKEKSTSSRRSDHDEKIRYREHQSRSGSGLDPGPSGDHIRPRRGRESSEESHRSRARYREIGSPHDQRKRARESEHDHREHYHDHKRKRGH